MADAVAEAALQALQDAVTALLPGSVPAGLDRQVRVSARRIRPLGMGGYVGRHEMPDATLLGRRVAARVDVDVTGGNDTTARQYVATLSGQVLAQTRGEFATRGIHRIEGVDVDDSRQAAFNVDFEFVRIPVTGEGLITTLPLESFNNVTPYRTRLVADFSGAALAIDAAPLADFAAVTDAQAAPPGVWAVSAASATGPAAIVQTAASVGGALTLADPRKAGTMLLWRPRGRPFDLPRFVASAVFSSASPDGVGLVFHRRAADDYRFFLASQRHGYHLFGRRRPAGFETIASAPFGFATDRTQRLMVMAYDGQLIAELDERRTLVAGDPEPATAGGEFGLLTHGNDAARFQAGRLMQLV